MKTTASRAEEEGAARREVARAAASGCGAGRARSSRSKTSAHATTNAVSLRDSFIVRRHFQRC